MFTMREIISLSLCYHQRKSPLISRALFIVDMKATFDGAEELFQEAVRNCSGEPTVSVSPLEFLNERFL